MSLDWERLGVGQGTPAMNKPSLLLQSCRDRCRWYDLVLIRGIGGVIGLLGIMYLWTWFSWLIGIDTPHPRKWLDQHLWIGFPILAFAYLLIRLNRMAVAVLGIGYLLYSVLVVFTHPLAWAVLLAVGLRPGWLLRKPAGNAENKGEAPATSQKIPRWKIVLIISVLVAGSIFATVSMALQHKSLSAMDLIAPVIGLLISLGVVLLVIRRSQSKQPPTPPPLP